MSIKSLNSINASNNRAGDAICVFVSGGFLAPKQLQKEFVLILNGFRMADYHLEFERLCG